MCKEIQIFRYFVIKCHYLAEVILFQFNTASMSTGLRQISL